MIIKAATPDMSQAIIDFVKVTSAETKNLITTPEEFNITVEQEKEYIQKQLDSRLGNQLVAMDGDKIVGLCGLHGREGRTRVSHICSLGITVIKTHWGKGVGYALMLGQIEYAKENGISKIDLQVRTDNVPAINLYKKCGFEIEGINKRNMLVDGEYVDTFFMGLCI